MSGARVRPLRPGEARAAGDVLARSHQQDPAFDAVFPDARQRAKALPRLFRVWVRDALPYGGVYAALDDQRILGVAVWLPPGRFPLTLGRKLRPVVGGLRIFAAAPRAFPRLVRFQANAERQHPEGESWYLEIVGVDDGARGQGLGARLLEPVLASADRDGLRCYLETARAELVRWYERLGFAVTNPSVALVPDGPTHWQMSRPPRSAR